MADKETLVSELKTRRMALGWSLADLAGRCSIDEKSLDEWEHGSDCPRLDAAQRWGAALGLRLALSPADGEPRAGVQIDWEQRRVTVDGAPVRLTPMEWKGLERLAWVPGELVTHQALYHHLYGDDRPYCTQSTAIRVLITKLRRLLPLHIEARWGQGYVVSGLSPSRSRLLPGQNAGILTAGLRVPDASPVDERPLARADVIDLSVPGLSRTPAAPTLPPLHRSEELGVIERFLAERGATRCPDAATIERTPLPTLVWDKMKRKWVRPQLSGSGVG